jgi:hypothetical protein
VTFKDGGILPSVMASADPMNWYWYLYDDQEHRSDGCRHMVNEKMVDEKAPVPINSTLENAMLPCIKIHDLT